MNPPTKPHWRSFFFESNQLFQNIDGMGDWQKIRDAYPHLSDDDILDAREATYGGTVTQEDRDKNPNYGFRLEHDGERKLRDFFEQNGMSLS